MQPANQSRLSAARYVLDTDSVTFLQLGKPKIVQRIAQVHADEVATTIITIYEQLRGRLASINRNQTDQDLQTNYQRLQATHVYYCQVPVLSFDQAAAMRSANWLLNDYVLVLKT